MPASPTLARFQTNPVQDTAPAVGPSSHVVCLSSASPFEGTGHDNSEDDVDVVQREAEQLEEMIRGSRGIVVEAIEREWREEMQRVFRDEGERLCSEAYEGYLDRGRGAVFVSLVAGKGTSDCLRLSLRLRVTCFCKLDYVGSCTYRREPRTPSR